MSFFSQNRACPSSSKPLDFLFSLQMWTSVSRTRTAAVWMPSVRTPSSHTNASANQDTKVMGNAVKVRNTCQEIKIEKHAGLV